MRSGDQRAHGAAVGGLTTWIIPVDAAPLVKLISPSGCPNFAIALHISRQSCVRFTRETYAGEMKTGILLSFPRIVVLASASATFLRIRGRKWIF